MNAACIDAITVPKRRDWLRVLLGVEADEINALNRICQRRFEGTKAGALGLATCCIALSQGSPRVERSGRDVVHGYSV